MSSLRNQSREIIHRNITNRRRPNENKHNVTDNKQKRDKETNTSSFLQKSTKLKEMSLTEIMKMYDKISMRYLNIF